MTDHELKAVLDDSLVQRLKLEPGDTIVIIPGQFLSEAQKRYMAQALQAVFPDHKALILDPEWKLATVGA